MADKVYRISFHAKPIIVHASSVKQAIELAIGYLRQPETSRITVEESGKEDA